MKKTELFETEKAEASALLCADAGAEFSPCRKYRYALWRIWDKSLPLVMFIGLNPSTANENQNDPTIRRVVKMAEKWGYGGVYMMNVYPLVTAYPRELMDFLDTPFHDPEDMENARWLMETASKCADVIFAWGNFKIVKDAKRDKMLAGYFPNALALILNKDGSPRHPLYVPSGVVPVKYSPSICL